MSNKQTGFEKFGLVTPTKASAIMTIAGYVINIIQMLILLLYLLLFNKTEV